jgi:hypothetical protein
MSAIEIQGSIIEIRETEEVGTNGFQKRLMVVDTGGEYPQKLPIEFVQTKTELLDKFEVGDDVIVSVNIRGREYEKNFETNYFLSLQGWRIVKNGSQ